MTKLTIKHYLIIASLLLTAFLIIFQNLGKIPLGTGDFFFALFISLAFSLYRPGWAFLFLVATIPLENINLTPESFSLIVRPYQLVALSIGASLVIRHFTKKINFSLPRWHFSDIFIIILVLASFWSALLSEEKDLAFKLSFVMASFAFIYLLGRIYLQEIGDLRRIIPVFLGSSFIISLYGIWQNFRFTRGLPAFEVMPGRPNATFTEPDWMGIYLVLIVSLVFSSVYFFLSKKTRENQEEISNFEFRISKQFENYNSQITKIFLFIFLVSTFVLLIISVSRSAWAGAVVSAIFFLFLVATNLRFNPKMWNLRTFGKSLVFISASLIISLGLVYALRLTTFELGSRAASSGGEEKITLACDDDRELPKKISSLAELENFSCQHIDLEDIEVERSEGRFIREILRPDPNVNIRAKIYGTVWNTIKDNWIAGIGWGNIGKILGTDERGATLNASNMFLEVYLGSGIVGFLAFILLLGYIFLRNAWKFFFAQSSEHKTLALFVLIALAGLSMANLWNSGIMLGFMWLFLVIGLVRK